MSRRSSSKAPHEEEGVEAMELTVDGKARANNGGIH
jgi:hypothetical protein